MTLRPLSLVKSSPISRPNHPSFSFFWFTFWLLRIGILSVSLSAIGGVVLTTLKPTSIPFFSSLKINPEPTKPSVSLETQPVNAAPSLSLVEEDNLPLKQELLPLKQKILSLAQASPKLKPYGLFVDLDNGNYVDINSTKILSSASTIKLFVLFAFFQDVDAGKIRLDESLTMTKNDMATGSGNMQYEKPDRKFTALETVTRMIVISDNTATNMLIRRLGGQDAINSRILSWGITSTSLKSPLPDLQGTNKSTAKDLASILYKINQGQLVSLKSRDRMINILEATKTNTLLPQGLEDKAEIAHKTGDIGSILGDAGIINMPNGKRYIGVVFVERPYNDAGGKILIQEISKIMNQGLKNIPNE